MLPITHGDAYTRRQVLYYTIALTAVSVLPFAVGMSGVVYLAGALILGAGFLMCAVALVRGNSERAPLATFKYSIVYLTLLFAVLLVDHYLPV